MIKSMTGYGRAKYENEGREYIVEVKSVNHKYNDISIKLPRSISYLEEKIKQTVSASVSRGKIDVFITFYNNSDKGKEVKINHELAEEYVKELKYLVEKTGVNNNINVMDLAKFPDVLMIQNDEDEELIWGELKIALKEALDSFIIMRQEEGRKMAEDLERRIKEVEQKVSEISKASTGLVNEYVVKLEERIKELMKTDVVDQMRLAQEVVIYSDKCSVEEELTRLNSHIFQFLQLVKEEKPVGKKLDFLMQEMNRETNTIGSKANSLAITNLVVDIKTELENIREQVQNIE